MTAIDKERIEKIITGGCTSADVLGAIGTLTDEAIAGDAQARRMLHALDFQQQLSAALMSNIRSAIRVLGLPVAPVACIASALASVIESIGLEIAPTIHQEFEEVRAELAATPEIMSDRARGRANFDARIAFAEKCKAEGLSPAETKQRVSELYQAQLKDFIVSNDREEALAS